MPSIDNSPRCPLSAFSRHTSPSSSRVMRVLILHATSTIDENPSLRAVQSGISGEHYWHCPGTISYTLVDTQCSSKGGTRRHACNAARAVPRTIRTQPAGARLGLCCAQFPAALWSSWRPFYHCSCASCMRGIASRFVSGWVLPRSVYPVTRGAVSAGLPCNQAR